MNIKIYNIFMFLATLLAWLGWLIIIGNFDPQQANFVVFLLFYSVLWLAILGTFFLLGFGWRQLFRKRRSLPRIVVHNSFRQALILATIMIVALFLQAGRVLTWWNIILLVVLGTVIEFVLLVFRREPVNNLDN